MQDDLLEAKFNELVLLEEVRKLLKH